MGLYGHNVGIPRRVSWFRIEIPRIHSGYIWIQDVYNYMICIDIHVFYHTYRRINFINQLINSWDQTVWFKHVQIFQSLLPNQGPLSKGFCHWSNLQPAIWGHVSRRCLFRVAFMSFLHVLSISDVSAVELTEALRHSGKVFRLQKAAPTAVSESVWSCTSKVKWRNRWVCLKIGYIPNYSHLIGIMIINHWV